MLGQGKTGGVLICFLWLVLCVGVPFGIFEGSQGPAPNRDTVAGNGFPGKFGNRRSIPHYAIDYREIIHRLPTTAQQRSIERFFLASSQGDYANRNHIRVLYDWFLGHFHWLKNLQQCTPFRNPRGGFPVVFVGHPQSRNTSLSSYAVLGMGAGEKARVTGCPINCYRHPSTFTSDQGIPARFSGLSVFQGCICGFKGGAGDSVLSFCGVEHSICAIPKGCDLFFGEFDKIIGLFSTGLHLSKLLPHRLPLEPHIASLPLHLMGLTRHDPRLSAIDDHLSNKREELQEANKNQQPCKGLDLSLYLYVAIGVGCGILNFGGWMLVIGRRKWRLLGWLVLVVSSVALLTDLGTFAFGSPLAFWRFRWLLGKDDYCEYQPLHSQKLYHKNYLTQATFCNTVSLMANTLSAERQTAIIAALAEGSSIRSIERITGVHRDTIMRLGVRVGKGCQMLMESKMQDLDCHYLQFDELWGFIGKKERHVSVDDNPELGDVWTFCAIDSETKLVPSFKVGKRTHATTTEFVQDVASRMRNRVQVSSDAMHLYAEAMELAFGSDVDYGQCVKVYVHDAAQHPERKYSAPHFASAVRRPITGQPDMELVSASHVERLNATTRLHVKRLSRLTLAFSKKLENFEAAVGLHFAYYNFVKRHNTLRCTPAMAAGVERDFWSVGDLVQATA